MRLSGNQELSLNLHSSTNQFWNRSDDMNILNDIFDSDEIALINSASQGVSLKDFTRQRFIDNLNFTLNTTNDEMVFRLVDGLKTKLLLLNDDDWNGIVIRIPLFTAYDT
jgi:hypothetical protein